MIISKIKELIKGVLHRVGERDIFIVFLFISGVIISFNVGRFAEKEDNKKIEIETNFMETKTLSSFKKTTSPEAKEGLPTKNFEKTIWGSKSGTKFYYAWCSGASRVKEENRVYYDSKEAAENSGRSLASNCK